MYSQGEVVLIPVPFTDLSASKRRPVLIISNDSYNNSNPDFIVVAVTSNLIQQGISLTNGDMIQGSLPKPSVVRCDKIYTLHQGIVVKSIGHIANTVLASVRTEITNIIS